MAFSKIREALQQLLETAGEDARPQGRHGAHGKDIVTEMGVPIPQRTVVRSQGCWNCKHFDNGLKARMQWDKRMFDTAAAVAKKALATGRTMQQANVEAAREVQRAEKLWGPPGTGLCAVGAVDAEFVSHRYLCAKWTGKDGTHEAVRNQGIDQLPGEVRERLDAGEAVKGGTVADVIRKVRKESNE